MATTATPSRINRPPNPIKVQLRGEIGADFGLSINRPTVNSKDFGLPVSDAIAAQKVQTAVTRVCYPSKRHLSWAFAARCALSRTQSNKQITRLKYLESIELNAVKLCLAGALKSKTFESKAANKSEDGGVGTGHAYSQPSYSQVVKTRATEAGLHGPSKASQRPPKPRYPQRQGILRPFVLEPSSTPIGAP
jgi:hypothetical protein